MNPVLKLLVAAVCLAPAAHAEINDGKDEYQMLGDEIKTAGRSANGTVAGSSATSSDYLAMELSKNIATMDAQTVLYNLDTVSELTDSYAAKKAYTDALARPESAVKIAALKQLGQYRDAETESLVIKQLETGDYTVRLAAVQALFGINGSKTKTALQYAAETDDNAKVRSAAKSALEKLPQSKPAKYYGRTDSSDEEAQPQQPAGNAEKLIIAPNTTFSNKKGPGSKKRK
ncbi:MAG: HEAT repeat domain-containing protein [Elusimicrobiaceae bacterium]|nr:HEAT repeat domain-containing protein [Elusimicrobiaceae bacterium]